MKYLVNLVAGKLKERSFRLGVPLLMICIVILGTRYTQTFASMRAIQIQPPKQTERASPQWKSYNGKDVFPKSKKIEMQMYLAKGKFLEKKYLSCLQELKKIKKRPNYLQVWISYWELKCLLSSSKKNIKAMNVIVAKIEKNISWVDETGVKDKLRPLYFDAKLAMLEFQVKRNKKAAWRTYMGLINWINKMDEARVANLYKLVGDLAFSQQKFEQAKFHYIQSLKLKKSRRILKKLKSFTKISESDIFMPTSLAKKGQTSSRSEKEQKIYTKMQENLISGDMVAAVEDGMEILKYFPWGQKADWANRRIIEVYLKIVAKRDPKLFRVEEKILNAMHYANEERLNYWANRLLKKEKYSDVVDLLKESLQDRSGSRVQIDNLVLAAQASLFIGNYGQSEDYLNTIISSASGTKQQATATYRLGLLMYRWQKYEKSIDVFESYLSGGKGVEMHVEALYWYWRSLVHISDARSGKIAKKLYEQYPMHLYGLLAWARVKKNILTWPPMIQEVKRKKLVLWVSPKQGRAWDRFSVFLKAGWYEAARIELGTMPLNVAPKDKYLIADLWAKAKGHQKSARLFYQAWDSKAEAIDRASVGSIYPKEFEQIVSAEAIRNNLDPIIIYSLIKQESSFDPNAESPAKARGLMQLMPGTAREVAKNLKWKKFQASEIIFSPNGNIKLGAKYLQRMIRAFKGHVPLALAAYNVGIGNMRKWLKSRPSLGALTNRAHFSGKWDDVWVDELPWAETTGYVKSVLRNYLIYKLLTDSKVDLNKIWWVGPAPK